ncbi:unnamed protein product [Calypogeia fissa]
MEDAEFFKAGEEEPAGSSPAPSLFPVAPSRLLPSSSSSTSAAPTLFPSFASAPPVFPVPESAKLQPAPAPEWPSHSSFSESLLPPPQHTSTSQHTIHPTPDLENAGRPIRSSEGGTEDAGGPSSSDGEEDSERGSSALRRHRKKSHRKRRREVNGTGDENKHKKKKHKEPGRAVALDGGSSLVERRPGTATSLADRSTAPKKEYYFDTRGDRESLIYGSLYRMDVARYSRSEINGNNFDQGFLVRFDGDGEVAQDEKGKTGSRYWSLKFSSLQRKRKLPHLRIGNHKFEKNGTGSKSAAPLAHFVPLDTTWRPIEGEGDLEEESKEEGETWVDYVAHKTKELNRLSRERPHDESVWIRFANFQDELIQATGNRAAIQNLVAKKMAILEKAMDSHKDSEDLLIFYLETCRRHDDAATLLRKWERAVHSHSGSLRMWQEFLRFRLSQFSTFSVSATRSLYNHALQALTAARNKLASKAIGEDNHYEDFVEAEGALVSIFLDLCRFNWQAGHQELAVGLFQAQIEYSIFSPRLMLTEGGKLTLFESFWSSGAPRFGEEGALGWATFLEEDQKAREGKILSEAQMAEEEVGGWTGWSSPIKDLVESNGSGQPLEEEAWHIEEDAQVDDDVVHEEEDEAALLEKLGLSFSSTKDVEVKDTRIWKRWSVKEVERDRYQWFPVNSQMSEEDDQLESMVLFDDIKESLFTLQSQQARLSLIHQFIDFCDGPLSQWCCSNSGCFLSELDSLVSLSRSMVADLDGLKWPEHGEKNTLTKLLRGPSWYEECKGRAKFLQNCLGLLKSEFPHDRFLSDTMLETEELAAAEETESQTIPFRALAKKLLKKHRKDLLMWGAYAYIEAAAGNITTARTVFDTTLASLGDPSTEGARDAPILYLAYAEMELAQVSQEPQATSPEQRALYILCGLGSGSAYVPQSGRDSLPMTTLLKGHKGFREHLQRVRISDRRNLTERGAALIACAAMFEQLTNGWEAGTAVFEEGLAMCLPETRQQSLQCELLFLRYVRMLEKASSGPKPARLRSTLLQGLGQYPHNSQLIGAYVENAVQSARNFDLRRYFDNAAVKRSSPTLWLFALSCELWRTGAGPRIHRLFERGLESKETQQCVLLWRCYLAYEVQVAGNAEAARRVYFRAIHACPWSKTLWLDGFLMLGSILSAKELSDFVDVMRDKELRLRTDVYEILLEDEEV